jgi:hypothetical protein
MWLQRFVLSAPENSDFLLPWQTLWRKKGPYAWGTVFFNQILTAFNKLNILSERLHITIEKGLTLFTGFILPRRSTEIIMWLQRFVLSAPNNTRLNQKWFYLIIYATLKLYRKYLEVPGIWKIRVMFIINQQKVTPETCYTQNVYHLIVQL